MESVILGVSGVGLLVADAWNQGEGSKRARAVVCRINRVERKIGGTLILSGEFPGNQNQVTTEGTYKLRNGSGRFSNGPILQGSWGSEFTPTRITIHDPFASFDFQRIHEGLVFDAGSVRISVTSPECSAVQVYDPPLLQPQ